MGHRGNGGCVRLVPAIVRQAKAPRRRWAIKTSLPERLRQRHLEKLNRWLNGASRLISKAGAEHIRPGAVVPATPGCPCRGTPSGRPTTPLRFLDGQSLSDFESGLRIAIQSWRCRPLQPLQGTLHLTSSALMRRLSCRSSPSCRARKLPTPCASSI